MASSKAFLGKVQGFPLALEASLVAFFVLIGFLTRFFEAFLLLAVFGATSASSLMLPPFPVQIVDYREATQQENGASYVAIQLCDAYTPFRRNSRE